MNAVQTKMESGRKEGDARRDAFQLEAFFPIGTFAGSQDFILRVRNGKPVAGNTGDQGGGQN